MPVQRSLIGAFVDDSAGRPQTLREAIKLRARSAAKPNRIGGWTDKVAQYLVRSDSVETLLDRDCVRCSASAHAKLSCQKLHRLIILLQSVTAPP